MKINLLLLAKNKKLSTQLETYVDTDKAEKARDFLNKYFPSQVFLYANDGIIMEAADILASLQYELDDFDGYLNMLNESASRLIDTYHEKKQKAKDQLSRLNYHSKRKYNLMSRDQIRELSYDETMISELLTYLDARENYQMYSDGYEYERYKINSWIKNQIIETQTNNTHDSINFNKRMKEIIEDTNKDTRVG